MDEVQLERISDGARRLGRVFLFEEEDDLLVAQRRYGDQTAQEIQLRVLPTRPPVVPGYAINFWSRPAAEVGGDHFNFCSAGGDSVGILIADVSGKGLGAAVIVTMLRATFRTQSWGNHSVANVLTRANDFISRVLPLGTFVTCAYGLLNTKTRTFTFARAGHEPLLLCRDGAVKEIAPPGLPLGISGPEEFRACLNTVEITLQAGDRLLLFTDGLTEAMNHRREEFGLDRVITTLRYQGRDDIDNLRREVDAHLNGCPPHDDMTMVSLRVE